MVVLLLLRRRSLVLLLALQLLLTAIPRSVWKLVQESANARQLG